MSVPVKDVLAREQWKKREARKCGFSDGLYNADVIGLFYKLIPDKTTQLSLNREECKGENK